MEMREKGELKQRVLPTAARDTEVSGRPTTVGEAIRFFHGLVEIDPTFGFAHASLCRCYALEGRYDLAWKHAQEADRLGDSSAIENLRRLVAQKES